MTRKPRCYLMKTEDVTKLTRAELFCLHSHDEYDIIMVTIR